MCGRNSALDSRTIVYNVREKLDQRILHCGDRFRMSHHDREGSCIHDNGDDDAQDPNDGMSCVEVMCGKDDYKYHHDEEDSQSAPNFRRMNLEAFHHSELERHYGATTFVA